MGVARICSACRTGDTGILVARRDLSEKWMREGNILSGEQLHMRGMDVFNFGLRVVPSGIKEILSIRYGDRRCGYNPFPPGQPFHDGFLRQEIERFPLDRCRIAWVFWQYQCRLHSLEHGPYHV